MRHTSFIRTAGVIALVATAMFSIADANARGFGGGFHGGGFHGGGFGGYQDVHHGAFRSGRVGTRVGHSFLLQNQSNPVFATGF